MDIDVNRREFLKAAGLATSCIIIGIQVPARAKEVALTGKQKIFNNYFVIGLEANDFTFVMDKAEMGQGVITGQVTLFCEELDLDPKMVKVIPAPVDKVYGTTSGMQITGGSSSTPDRWQVLRQAGANIRAAMVAAASAKLKVPEKDLVVSNGAVSSKDRSKMISFNELAEQLKIDEDKSAPLKDPKDFKYIGKKVAKVDAPEKSLGRAKFGIDFHKNGLLVACILRPPTFGGKVKSFDGKAALKSPGIKNVIEISRGIAVVGEKFWQVKKALSLVEVQWDKGENAGLTSEKIQKDYDKLLKEEKGKEAHSKGDVDKVFDKANKDDIVEAVYELPYLAHACMEPMNASAHVQKNRADVWVATQGPTSVQNEVADFLGLSRDKVFIHNEKYLGGGFGRRSTLDYPLEAVEISKKINAPIKVIWTREDDTKFSPMRPINRHHFKAAVTDGKVVGYEHRLGCESILQSFMPGAIPQMLPGWLPSFVRGSIAGIAGGAMNLMNTHMVTAEGAAEIDYDIPHQFTGIGSLDLDIPIHFWRSVGHSYNGFVKESFIDELAHKAGKDPYKFRREMLKKNKRALGVLDKVAEMSNWESTPPEGISRGIAYHFSFGTWVAEVAEVRVSENGGFEIEKVYCAVDCGVAINPDVVVDQMKSGIIYGLSAALGAKIDLADGGVVQSNFHDYPVMRMTQTPEIEVAIIPSGESPMGVGEPGLPPAAPAVSNALFAATGKRIRTMPFSMS